MVAEMSWRAFFLLLTITAIISFAVTTITGNGIVGFIASGLFAIGAGYGYVEWRIRNAKYHRKDCQ
jgi:hypothetical protein